jgi:hypothetical protein
MLHPAFTRLGKKNVLSPGASRYASQVAEIESSFNEESYRSLLLPAVKTSTPVSVILL